MFPPRWFLPYDAAFQLITGLVALAVAVYALQGYRWVKERTLYALFLAFTLLSVALLVNSITLSYTYLVDMSFAHHAQGMCGVDIGFWVYYLISALAFLILVYAYASRLQDASIALASMLILGQRAVGGSIVGFAPYMELVLVALLVIIVLAQVFHLMLPSLDLRECAGNVAARCRMIVLFHHAWLMGRVVMGTSNKSEFLIGYFTKFGDGGSDFCPIGDLYKTEVRQLAREIGVPDAIIDKTPSAGLWEGQTDEGEMGITYEDLDQVLFGIERSLGDEAIAAESGVPLDKVHKVRAMSIQGNSSSNRKGYFADRRI